MVDYDIVTFDCYGTLIDWEGGIVAAFQRACGSAVDRASLLEAYAAIEAEVEAGPYRRYHDVLDEVERQAVTRLGLAVTGTPGFLVSSLPDWTPFPDTNPALVRLAAAGVQIGILSNVDDDLLMQTCRWFSVQPSLIVTAEQVRSYKPSHGHFLTARGRIGTARWLHAAQSYFHDIVPATTLGIASAWINRSGAVTGHLPDAALGRPRWTLPTLTELSDRLLP